MPHRCLGSYTGHSRVYSDLRKSTGPGIAGNTKVVQGAANLHHEVAHAFFPQANGVFGDATALDTTDNVFDGNTATRHLAVEGFLLVRERATFGLLDRARVLYTW